MLVFDSLYLFPPYPIEQTYSSSSSLVYSAENQAYCPIHHLRTKGPVLLENWTFCVKKLISFDDRYYAIDSTNCVDAADATDSMAHMDFADATDSTYRADTDDATDSKACMDVVDAIDSMYRADTVYATAPKVHEDVADAIDSTCRADADDAIVPMEHNAAVLDACFFNSFSFATSYVHFLI